MRVDKNDFVVGVVGDVIPRKGQQYLFEAIEQIVAAVPNFKLIMVGRLTKISRTSNAYEACKADQPCENRVKWLGLRNNVQDFMAAFDLTVVPSIEEPLGLVALESLATGTPVVASNVGGLPEIVKPNDTGLLVSPKNPSELARAVIAMAQDPAMRQRLGENGRHFVQESFAPDKLTRQVESILMRVAKRKSVAA